MMIDYAEIQSDIAKAKVLLAGLELPVGSRYSTNVLNGYPDYGTWALADQGRFIAAYSGTSPFNTVSATGGRNDVIVPQHLHPSQASGTITSTTTTVTSGNVSAGHTHSATAASAGAHVHYAYRSTGIRSVGASGTYWTAHSAGTSGADSTSGTTTESAAHTHTYTSGGVSANHTHTVSYYRLYAHTHPVSIANTGSTGLELSNLPPYQVVYIYRRTA